MKKKFIIFLIFAVVSLFGIGIITACDSSNLYKGQYYATYGTWFDLPQADTVDVYDSDGRRVATESGKLFVTDDRGYTLLIENGGKKYDSAVAVINEFKPVIFTDREFVYSVVGKPISSCKATASDGVREIPVTAELYYGEELCGDPEEFIPQSVGIYKLKYTATAPNGRNAVKELDCYVEPDKSFYENKISSFDKPYGVRQIAHKYGLTSYSTEYRFADEAGSVGIDLNTRINGGTCEFSVVGLDQPDINDYDAIYFYVFNASKADLSIYFNWSKKFTLRSNTWTRVFVVREEYLSVLKENAYPNVQNNLSLDDINGLNFSVSYSVNDFVLRGDKIYLSAMRGLKRKSPQEVNELLSQTDWSELESDNIDYYCSALSDTQRKQLLGYDRFMTVRFDKLRSSASVTEEEGKLFYFDEPAGVNQIDALWGVGEAKCTTEVTYGDRATLCLVADAWDVAIKLTQPYLYDISGYDYLEVNIFSDYDGELLLYNSDPNYRSLGVSGDYSLAPRVWNRLTIPVGRNKDAVGTHLWIRPKTWEDKTGVTNGRFYIAAIYGREFGYGLDETALQSEDFNYLSRLIYDVYGNMEADRRATVAVTYQSICLQLARREAGEAWEGKKVFAFDEKRVSEQINGDGDMLLPSLAEISYDSEIKYENEAGSTVFVGKSTAIAGIELYLKNADIPLIPPGSKIRMYVYFQGTGSYNVYFHSREQWDTESVATLVAGEWTEVTICVENILDISDYVLRIDDNWRLHEGDEFRLSALMIVE